MPQAPQHVLLLATGTGNRLACRSSCCCTVCCARQIPELLQYIPWVPGLSSEYPPLAEGDLV
jgi:hypothetical protein